jgi:hypothetical protein
MEQEALKRYCRALSMWAEVEVSHLFEKAYIGPAASSMEVRFGESVVVHEYKHLVGSGFVEQGGTRPWGHLDTRSSPEDASKGLVEWFVNYIDLADMVDKRLVLFWREPPRIQCYRKFDQCFVADCSFATIDTKELGEPVDCVEWKPPVFECVGLK